MSNNLFIVRTISLKKLSQKDIEKDFEVTKILSPIWKDKTIEEFIEFKKGFNDDKYSLEGEDFTYVQDKDSAEKCILRNQADMNDGGAYKYAAILEVPYGVSYSTSMYLQSFELYEFNKEKETYEKVSFDKNEETQTIKGKYCVIVQ